MSSPSVTASGIQVLGLRIQLWELGTALAGRVAARGQQCTASAGEDCEACVLLTRILSVGTALPGARPHLISPNLPNP